MEYNKPNELDWRRTYAGGETIPYGCNAFYRILEEDLYEGKCILQEQSIYSALKTLPEEPITYMFVNSTLSLSAMDSRRLLDFVKAGNSVFIAANQVEGLWCDTLHLKTVSPAADPADSLSTGVIQFTNPGLREKKWFEYPKGLHSSYVSGFDTLHTTVLANSDSNVVFIQTGWGKGNFYFFSVPDIYTNYFFVHPKNKVVVYKTMAYLPASQLWWDENYKLYHHRRGSDFQFILNNDSLYRAYLLGLMALLIFMIFALKRRQRAIPLKEPLLNTSLQFTEVLARVYYRSKNHKMIADEKLLSFLEFIRIRFAILSNPWNEHDIQRISKLSEIPPDSIKSVNLYIQKIRLAKHISEQELIEFNTLLENFYRNNKR